MKRRKLFFSIMTLLVFGITGSCLAGPPESGEITSVQGEVDAPPFQVVAVNSQENAVKFLLPVRPDQYQTDKQGEQLPQNPDIQVYASYAYAQNGKWVLTGSNDSSIEETGSLTNGQVEAYMSFPDQGSGWFWVRTWAKDLESGNWVWVNESSKFCRYDNEGNPGYEFLVNPETGEKQPVPQSYQGRD